MNGFCWFSSCLNPVAVNCKCVHFISISLITNKGHLICNLTGHNCNLITKEDRTKVRLPKRNCPLHAELSL